MQLMNPMNPMHGATNQGDSADLSACAAANANAPDTTARRGLRAALAAASCALLMPGSASAAGEAATPEATWKVDAGFLSYSEKDRIRVDETFLLLKKQLNEDDSLTFRGGYDVVSGASPTGLTPVQTNTGASASATLAPVSIRHTAVGGTWEQRLNETRTLSLGADHTRQNAHTSLAGNASLSEEFNQRNTTLNIGLAYTREDFNPDGGIKQEMTASTANSIRADRDDKQQVDLQLGLTQVLGPRTLFSLSGTLSQQRGYLSNGYKYLSVVDANTGETLHNAPLTERRPDQRQGQSIQLQLNHHLDPGTAYLTYRLYGDDWGVHSHTLDVKYRQPVSERSYLQPHARWYKQSAANFYRPFIVQGATPEYASADYRLNALQSTSLGLKFGYRMLNMDQLTVRYEVMKQTGEQHPDGVFGVQTLANFFPEMVVQMLHVGYSAAF